MNKQATKTGFTLIELVIAAGIFSTLLIILLGLFSRFMFTQRRDIADQKLLEDVRFALELFDREARTAFGSTFSVTDSNGHGVLFRNQNGACVHYRYNEQERTFQRAESFTQLNCELSEMSRIFGNATYATLISTNDVEITDARFDAVRTEVVDGELQNQGFITVMLDASSNDATIPSMHVQTTLTSRQVLPYEQAN